MVDRPKVALSTLISQEEFYQHARAINRLSEEDYVAAVLDETLEEGLGINITLNPTTNKVTISSTGGGGDTGSDGVIGGGRRFGEDGYIIGGRRYT